MILYSKPLVDQVLSNYRDQFRKITDTLRNGDYNTAIEELRLSYKDFEADINSIPEHKIINRNACLSSWIYKKQNRKSLTMTFENVVYTNHGLEGKVYRYCKEYATCINLDLSNKLMHIDDDILMLDVTEREAIDIEARHKKDILDLTEVVRDELDFYCSHIINDMKKVIKVFNDNPQPDFNDPKIMHICTSAVRACAQVADL